jgi:hypothetical protein
MADAGKTAPPQTGAGNAADLPDETLFPMVSALWGKRWVRRAGCGDGLGAASVAKPDRADRAGIALHYDLDQHRERASRPVNDAQCGFPAVMELPIAALEERLERAAEQLERAAEDLLHLPHFHFQQHSRPTDSGLGPPPGSAAAQDTTDVNIPGSSLLANRGRSGGQGDAGAGELGVGLVRSSWPLHAVVHHHRPRAASLRPPSTPDPSSACPPLQT